MNTAYTSILLLAGLLMAAPLCQAQAAARQTSAEQGVEEIPGWLIDFSNLEPEKRDTYVAHFNNAKQAYHQSQWIECIAQLAECEIIVRGNPNVWNLRASCLLEQKYFKEAEQELQRVLQVMPHDPVTIMNLANVHLACGRYEESLKLIIPLRDTLYLQHSDDELLYVLDYRALLCYLKLGQLDKVKAIASSVSPMADTPLYYYAKASMDLASGNRSEAIHNLNVVERIFANNRACIPYQRALEISGLLETAATTQTP